MDQWHEAVREREHHVGMWELVCYVVKQTNLLFQFGLPQEGLNYRTQHSFDELENSEKCKGDYIARRHALQWKNKKTNIGLFWGTLKGEKTWYGLQKTIGL